MCKELRKNQEKCVKIILSLIKDGKLLETQCYFRIDKMER